MVKNLILLRGVSGSGKSTIAKLFSFGNRIVSTDDFFIDKDGNYTFDSNDLKVNHEKCQYAVKLMMEEFVNGDIDLTQDTIIVHNTFTANWEMDAYFDLARKYGYAVHTMIVENRHGSKNVHDVPQDVIKAQIERFSVTL